MRREAGDNIGVLVVTQKILLPWVGEYQGLIRELQSNRINWKNETQA